jgi:hypothetical protein
VLSCSFLRLSWCRAGGLVAACLAHAPDNSCEPVCSFLQSVIVVVNACGCIVVSGICSEGSWRGRGPECLVVLGCWSSFSDHFLCLLLGELLVEPECQVVGHLSIGPSVVWK